MGIPRLRGPYVVSLMDLGRCCCCLGPSHLPCRVPSANLFLASWMKSKQPNQRIESLSEYQGKFLWVYIIKQLIYRTNHKQWNKPRTTCFFWAWRLLMKNMIFKRSNPLVFFCKSDLAWIRLTNNYNVQPIRMPEWKIKLSSEQSRSSPFYDNTITRRVLAHSFDVRLCN